MSNTLLINTTQSEQLILAAILLDSGLFGQVAAQLEATDFQDELHRLVFRAMKLAHERGAPLNPIVLACEANYISSGEKYCTTADIECLTINHPNFLDLEKQIEIVREAGEKTYRCHLDGCSDGILPSVRGRDALATAAETDGGTNSEVSLVKKLIFRLLYKTFNQM